MSRLSFSVLFFLAGGVLLAAAVIGEQPARGQQPIAPKNLTTVDGVRLNATFYPGPKGKDSPTVILLHPLGEGKSGNTPEWRNLAVLLQKNNYAVMRFDFRGHGESTDIDSPNDFWPLNSGLQWLGKRPKVKDDVIEVKDFSKKPGYLPLLINDIAAIKTYLDGKNDEGLCNTANTIVIGADQGATLGAIWINSEMFRTRFTPPMVGTPLAIDKRAEGNDIIGAIFLTIDRDLSIPPYKRPINLSATLTLAARERTKPMAAVFFYGSEDKLAKERAKGIKDAILKGKDLKKLEEKYKYIGPFEVPDTKLTGIKLLTPALKTDQVILKRLETIVSDLGTDWSKRDFQDSAYYWRFTPQMLPNWLVNGAKQKTDKLTRFDSYERFIPKN